MIGSTVIIGLTGQTGAGKSTVAGCLEKKYGFAVIDADRVAREVVEPGSPTLEALANAFSPEIFLSDGRLDRKALARLAFVSEKKTDLLNSITHPAISKRVFDMAKSFSLGAAPAVVIDAALLFKSEIPSFCDFTVAVLAPTEERLQRILSRDGISKEDAFLRINAQPDEEQYISRADVTVRNGSQQQPESECEKIYLRYKECFK